MNILKLADLIEKSETMKARRLVEEIISSHESSEYSKALVRVIIHMAAEKLNERTGGFYADISKLDLILFSSADISAVHEAIAFLHNEMLRAKEGNEKMLYEKAIKIILKSYPDQQFSASVVSKALGITPSAFSVLFKKYAGEGFSEYINRLRIEKSTELLLNSDEAVAAVSKAVGYTSAESYIRTFKKFKGVTPGAYRHL